MLLHNVSLLNGFAETTITVNDGKITAVSSGNGIIDTGDCNIMFTNAVAFPGLINSHDHLDFNCFSCLGGNTYKNYVEWGNHIHKVYKDEISQVIKIPQYMRTAWGIYKNLLAGVTTVVNHGDTLEIENPLIAVYQESQNLHSVRFQKRWKIKLNNPFARNKLCVIHAGEGTDRQAAAEIDSLLRWNLLHRKLVGVHAVAMNNRQAKKFTALVWCPESNSMLLNAHADISELSKRTSIVFGTDSTLTGHWNIWQHLRLARKLHPKNDAAIFNMATAAPARLWNINAGEIKAGKDADIVIAKANGCANWDEFYSVNPSNILMVLCKGAIRLFDETMLPQVKIICKDLAAFAPVSINGTVKYVAGNLPALMHNIKKHYPEMRFPVATDETVKRNADD